MRTKILFVIPNLKSGGAEKITITIINLLIKNSKYEIVLLLMNQNEMFYKKYLDDKITIDVLNYKRALDFFIKPRVFYKKINHYKPNYIFSGYGEINSFISTFALFFSDISFIARETSIPSLRVKKLYNKLLYFTTYRLFDKIIVQSIAMQNDLINNFFLPSDKLVLIHNPINISLLEKISNNNSIIRFNIDGKKLFLYIGTINENKNVDKIIKFYTKIREQGVNGTLLIVGSGPEDFNITNLINQNIYKDSIFKIPENINAPLYLEFADFLILASDYEGFPNVALEASYFGVPVILSINTLGGAVEFIDPNVNGVLIDFENPDFQFLNLNFNKQLIKNNILEKHSSEIFIKNVEKLLN